MNAKKLTKKLFAMVLAVVMMMAMSVTAFADPLGTGDGSITITNATVGDTYTIYKIFDTDSTGAGSITANSTQKVFYESQEDNPFQFTANSAGSYNVSVKVGVSDEDVIAFLQSFVTETPDGVIQVDSDFASVTDALNPKTATSATVPFNNIPYGYYLVTSSLGAVVTVNSTNPDIPVIDKNQDGGSNFTKTVNGEDKVVEIGEEFTFTLTFTATNYDGETPIESYTVSDTFPKGMDLVGTEDNVQVTIDDGSDESTTLTLDATLDSAGRNFNVVIPWSNKVEDNVTFLYGSPATVTVEYEAVLNENAEIQQDIKNDATLTWTGDNKGTSTEETVETYAMAILKVDEKGQPLDGATFEVTAGDEAVNVTEVNGQPGVYVVDPDSSSNSVVSPEGGLIVIKGVDDIEYTLTETDAPDGYNLLIRPVTITPTNIGSETVTVYYDEDGNVTETVTDSNKKYSASVPVTAKVVVNETGSTLPTTGGTGTTIIYIVGAILVIGAGVLLVTRRRMKAE